MALNLYVYFMTVFDILKILPIKKVIVFFVFQFYNKLKF